VDNLFKGAYWSLIIHAYVFGVLFFVSRVMARLDPKPPTLGIVLGGGGSEGGSPGAGGGGRGGGGDLSGGGGGAPTVLDVSEIIAEQPKRVVKAPSSPPPLPIDPPPALASRAPVAPNPPPPAIAQTQQSPSGPPLLTPEKPPPVEPLAKKAKKPPPEAKPVAAVATTEKPLAKKPPPKAKPVTAVATTEKPLAKKPPPEAKPVAAVATTEKAIARAKETEQERLERIRQGARTVPASGAGAASGTGTGIGSCTSAAPFNAAAIRDRLLSGVRGTGSGSGSGGGGGGRGTGGGGSGHGTGSGHGDGSGGRGHGTGGGQGDGSGPGSGLGDPFYSAIGAALYDAWTPPSRTEVGYGTPTVGVRITLRFDGTITAYQLSRPSGNAIMNASVEALMRSLRRLPAPASFGFTERIKTIEVRFALDAVGRGGASQLRRGFCSVSRCVRRVDGVP
jgi:hypothetical protein